MVDLFLETRRNVPGLGSVPRLAELPDEDCVIDARLLEELPSDRLVGCFAFVIPPAGTWVPALTSTWSNTNSRPAGSVR